MRNRLLCILLAGVVALACSACSTDWMDADSATEAILPSSTESTTAPLNTPGGPATHNLFGLGWVPVDTSQPYTNTYRLNDDVFKLVYEGLFSLNDALDPVTCLCRQVETTDNVTFTFYLRSGVIFHDGNPLASKDVVYSLEEARKPNSFYADRLTDVVSIRAAGEDAVTVTLRTANSRFPALLDIPIVRQGTAADPAPPGTGPYVLQWEEGGGYLLRFDDWWQQRNVDIARIELQPVQTPDVLPYQFENKLVSLVNADMTDTDPAVIRAGYEFWDYPTTIMQYLGFSGDSKSPMSNPLLRQAVSAAADRVAIAEDIFSFWVDPATLPVPPQHRFAESTQPNGFDLRVASEKLGEAGYADNDSDGFLESSGGKRLTVVFLVNTENEFKRLAAERIADELAALGFEVVLNRLRFEDYRAALDAGEYDLYYGETRLSCDWNLTPLFTGALRYAGGVSNELNTLHRDFMASSEDATARHAFYSAFADELPFAPLLFKRYAVLTQRSQMSGVAPVWQNVFLHIDQWELKR